MSRQALVNLFMLQTKLIVNTYTWATLPLYTVIQRPWRQLRLNKSFGVQATKDAHGRLIYSRECPKKFDHPFLNIQAFNDMIPLLDRNRRAVGIRSVLHEEIQMDKETGKPVKVDGKELKKMRLADQYHWYTAGEILDRVDAFANGLTSMGLQRGDKVIIYGDNSLEWFIASLALLRTNAVTVTLLPMLNDEGVLYGCNQCEAKYLITSQDLLPRVADISDRLEHCEKVIYIENKLAPKNDGQCQQAVSKLTNQQQYDVRTFASLEQTGTRMPPMKFVAPHKDETALIMYTSGTTGAPKGVMLTAHALAESLRNILRMQEERDIELMNTVYAGYLPMAHLYGYLLNLGSFLADTSLAFCSPLTMLDSSPAHVDDQKGDFSIVRPHFLAAVPLVLDRILKEVYRKLNSRTPVSAPIFTYLMDYKIRWFQRGYDTPIVNRLVCKKIRDQFGGNLEVMMVGSAPLHERTQAMVQAALNVKLIQGYGSTEVAAGSHSMANHDLGYGECGVPMHSIKYYLKDWPEGGYYTTDKPNPRGEIVVGGPTVATGYYKMPEETAEAFKVDENGERWFESGDIGEVLPNLTLKIIDRKKDLYKLANGEFISLGKIEAGLRSSKYVENICVCTSPYANHVTALITPNRRALAELAEILNKSSLTIEQLCNDKEVIDEVMRSVQESSDRLGFKRKEVPTTICLVKEEWTQDNNLLTAAFKMRRKQVNDYYRTEIDRMFAQSNSDSDSGSGATSRQL